MALRYWVGGGSSANWNATGNTNWGTSSGVQDNASVPTSVDDVIFDGSGVGGNTNSTISATITVKSLTINAGYTATMTHNAVLTIAGNWTMSNSHTIAGASAIAISTTSTITSNAQIWPNTLSVSGNISPTITISGNFTVNYCSFTMINPLTINGSDLITNGIVINNTVQGSSKLVLTGGTWSHTGGRLSLNTDINGNVTISGTVVYSGTLTYISGTVTTTGSTLSIALSSTLNTSGITWNNISVSGNVSPTITLTSNLTATGTSSFTMINPLSIIGAYTWSSNGITTANIVTYSGGSKLILTGGTWSYTSGAGLNANIDIAGNLTISGTVVYVGGTLKYVSGTVTTTGSTLSLTNNFSTTILDTNGITWNNVTLSSTSGLVYTINSLFSVSGTITFGVNANTTFTGTSGWTCGTLINASTQAATINLKDGNTYTINTLLDCYRSLVGFPILFTSSSATLKAILTLVNGAACNCLANLTRIDASGGRPIYTFNGTVTDCLNVKSFNDLTTIASSYVNL